MWIIFILESVLLIGVLAAFLKERKVNKMQQKNQEMLKKRASTIYLYGQLIGEAAAAARMKEYSRVVVHESEEIMDLLEKT